MRKIFLAMLIVISGATAVYAAAYMTGIRTSGTVIKDEDPTGGSCNKQFIFLNGSRWGTTTTGTAIGGVD